jgi:hypothetical protein
MPYAQIPSDWGNAYFKICREIARATPPAVQPDELDVDMRDFWKLLELCWQVQIDSRPGVNEIVHYLERYCSRGHAKVPEIPHAYRHRLAYPDPSINWPERSFQWTLKSPPYHVTFFFMTLLFLALLRFTTL